ncbi:hypothetical protein E2C01_017329 [Portunus trituberculatus]|uniref:Uncharacterized protein n=1 Tax=Portunus trituberculatus TaxID=210409 RepID=A0A5B7DS70_PORTR|nr:hypothetical protein [Portunus trituberculatus]
MSRQEPRMPEVKLRLIYGYDRPPRSFSYRDLRGKTLSTTNEAGATVACGTSGVQRELKVGGSLYASSAAATKDLYHTGTGVPLAAS